MNRREAIRRTTWGAGIGIMTPGILTMLQSCRGSTDNADWTPQVLSQDLAIRLDKLSDTILPETASPSATQVRVPQFIDLLMADVLTSDQSRSVVGGLEGLSKISEENQGRAFEKLSVEERTTLVRKIDEAAFSEPSSSEFDMTILEDYKYLKSLILMAYFTSEEGVKQNLNYVVIPGEFQACIDLPKEGRITVGNHM